MTLRTSATASLWLETGPEQPEHPEHDRDVETDVVVLGGGIVGVTTALLLKEAGARVVLLEAGRIGHGVTGHTTAKVSSQHGMAYSRLASRFGAGAAATYGAANEAALRWIADRVRADGIDCDLRRRPSYAYVTEDRAMAEREARAAIDAGLPASLVQDTPLPYPVAAAVRFEDQAEFHVHRYLLALAAQIEGDGCHVFEHSRAVEVDVYEGLTVKTPGGRVKAGHVVLATHFPFLDRTLAFARVHPQRSYALACRIAGEPPEGMFISGDGPTRSVRAAPVAGEELLLVGGEGHRPGTGGDTEQRYEALERFAREHWDVRSVEYRWSSQDNTTIDTVPYVGNALPRSSRLWTATGFAKWGMTGGTAAALLLADLIQGRANPSAELFDPNRLTLRASAARFVEENAVAGARFVRDRLANRPARRIDELEPGEGDIVELGGEKVAGHRRDDGTLIAVTPTCSHLGCQVNWNRAERSWDCPCHGSRFAPDGTVLHGPAVHRLERKPLEG
ncbi:MAG TPA: FAD-dependent oxidoreductase [Solirubrobacteraceae bacterium]|nr:FAD-dependent oxidoreductase [Solirubrobacteraceae bacterium]